ncbi:MAG: hypothetical protein IT429_16970 [Gemmataceae bacterium]|nr:hypothetical protein [Gemmataceae bacterium]
MTGEERYYRWLARGILGAAQMLDQARREPGAPPLDEMARQQIRQTVALLQAALDAQEKAG